MADITKIKGNYISDIKARKSINSLYKYYGDLINGTNTQIKVLNHIIQQFGKPNSRGKFYAKPVTIWAKSPINNKLHTNPQHP